MATTTVKLKNFIGGELVDPAADLVSDPANVRQRPARGVLDLPADVALAGNDGTCVVARRDDHVRPVDPLVVELRGHVVRGVEAELLERC